MVLSLIWIGLYDKSSIEDFLSKCDEVYNRSHYPLDKCEAFDCAQVEDDFLATHALQQSLFEE